MSGPFSKKHRCRISVICNCLVPGTPRFFPCCGWYCVRCDGRVNDDERRHKSDAIEGKWPG